MTVDAKEIVTTVGYMIGVKKAYWNNALMKNTIICSNSYISIKTQQLSDIYVSSEPCLCRNSKIPMMKFGLN